MMVVKGIRCPPEEEREVVERVKQNEVDVDAKTVEESTRDPSSSTSDSSCQTTVAKPVPFPGRTSGPTRRSTKGGWTEEEDEILARAVKQFKGKNWKKIAEFFPGRSDVQCLHRWQKVLDPELIKGAWTKEEDEHIIELVNKYGPKKWAIIARKMPGRIGKQCRERWHNHLNPTIKKGAWTTEEEITLIRAHQIYGNKWAEIAKFLPGRADNSIKNHWNCSVKKKLDSYLASGLIHQLPKIDALDLNNDPTDMECPKDFPSPEVSMIVDRKAMPAVVANSSSASLLHGRSRVPREDSECCKAGAQRIATESLRGSEQAPGFLKPLAAGYLDDTSPVGGDLIYLPTRECTNHANIQDCGSSFWCKDGYHHIRASDALVPTTPLQCKPHASIGNNSSLQMQFCEPNTKELFASPERFEGCASDSLAATNTTTSVNEHRASALQVNMLLDFDRVNYDQTPCTPVLIDKVNFDHDSHAPIQLSNLQEYVTEAKLMESCNIMIQPDSPVCCSAPPKLLQGTSFKLKDPETVLRNAAKSFRNMPSILRKRHQKHFGPSSVKKPHKGHADVEELSHTCHPIAKVESISKTFGPPHLCHCEIQTHDDKCPNDAQHVRQLFLLSAAPLKSEKYDALRSIEKRLELAFDMEWNDAKTNHGTSMLYTPLSVTVNNHIDISNNSQEQAV